MSLLTEHQIEIRVRYQETDGQARVHHANYLTYFEQARVELMRASGKSYKSLEESGLLLVLVEANVRYHIPSEFDDLLAVHVRTVTAKGARIVHEYRVTRGEQLICEGTTTIACIARDGRVQRLPLWLRLT